MSHPRCTQSSPIAPLERVQELTEAVGRATSIDEIYELALSCLEQALGADRTSVLLFDADGVMRFVAWHGLSEDYRQAIDGHSPWSADDADAQPLLVPDVRDNTELSVYGDVLAAEGIVALAFVPLRAEGRLIGKFMLYYDQPRSFERSEILLAQVVAGHVAFAVERTRKDAELGRARDELDAILHSVSDGLTVLGSDGRVLYVNDAAARVFGLSSREALLTISRSDFVDRYEFFDEDGQPLSVDDLPGPRAIRERRGVTQLVCFAERDGSEHRWALVSATPLFREEEALSVNVFRDVTAQRQTEAMLRERERQMRDAYAALRRAEARKDEFLAMLGHELRNPLSPIVTALQLMKLKGSDQFARERTIMERQVQHLLRLVDDLLDISRITRGKLELKRQPTALSGVVEKAVELALPLIEARELALEVDVPADLVVHGDPQRLAQVVANLLTNAAKNTPQHGHVSVRGVAAGPNVELAVRDDGAGIEPELVPRLFDLFVQGQQTIGREKGGLGLGLTIVKRLTEMHGGSVTVESEGLGRGSTFTVSLPRVESRPSATLGLSNESGDPETTPEGLRVLVVDDNVDAADTLAAALRATGHSTQVAYDAASALTVTANGPPDVAILDIGLPVMDGYELARRMRSSHGSRLRLIALTGYGQPGDRARSAEAGFDVHLVKPVALGDLLAVVSPA